MSQKILTDLDFANASKIQNLPNAVAAQEPATLSQLNAGLAGVTAGTNPYNMVLNPDALVDVSNVTLTFASATSATVTRNTTNPISGISDFQINLVNCVSPVVRLAIKPLSKSFEKETIVFGVRNIISMLAISYYPFFVNLKRNGLLIATMYRANFLATVNSFGNSFYLLDNIGTYEIEFLFNENVSYTDTLNFNGVYFGKSFEINPTSTMLDINGFSSFRSNLGVYIENEIPDYLFSSSFCRILFKNGLYRLAPVGQLISVAFGGTGGVSTLTAKTNLEIAQPKVSIFLASGTFVPEPFSKTFYIICIGAGGGGGGGRQGAAATVRCGGGGGGPGSIVRAFHYGPLANTTFLIGAAGTSGAGATTASTSGGAGGTGGITTFGSPVVQIARGGGGGGGGTASSGTAGAASVGEYTTSAGSAASTTGGVGVAAVLQTTGIGNGAGGSGGGITTANVYSAGGAGGNRSNAVSSVLNTGGGGAGVAGSGVAQGGAGNLGTSSTTSFAYGGAGGSSGAGSGFLGGVCPPATGYGAGGGGGGASLDGNAAGSGGAGGPGAIIIFEW